MKWEFEPGHTAATFKVRHMMVTWVRGRFTDIHGTLDFAPENSDSLRFEATIPIHTLNSGEKARDAHLLGPDFFDAEKHPNMHFKSKNSIRCGAHDFLITGELEIRGIKKETTMAVKYLGSWVTPYWKGDKNMVKIKRLGFSGKLKLNRHDFNVSWNDTMDRGGLVVGDEVHIALDGEAIESRSL